MNSTNPSPETIKDYNPILILSKPVYDNPKSFLFELLYYDGDGYWLAWKNTDPESKKEDLIRYPFPVLPESFKDVVTKVKNDEKLTNDEKLIEYWANNIINQIETEVTNNLSFVDYEMKQEIYNILIDLLDSICKIDMCMENNVYIEKPQIYIMETEIIEQKEKIKDLDYIGLKSTIKTNLTERKALAKTRKDLSDYLNYRHGVILKKDINTMYKLDKKGTGYIEVKFDDLIRLLGDDLGKNMVSNKDLTEALSFLTDRKPLEYNKVSFNNCIYDMKLNEVITPTEPIFTDIISKYNYNPNAESYILKDFLETSLEKETPEKTQEYIKGVLQIVGYLFTSGNPYCLLIFVVGVGGGGKSVFTNILTDVFGIDKIGDVSPQNLDNPHTSSSLIGKHLNIVRDADDRVIDNEDIIKQLTGDDPIQTNPKFKEAFTLKKEEVPKSLIVANAIPKFRKTSSSLLTRFGIIEFNKKFRGTDKEDINLLDKILEVPEEVEWLIYNGLKEYKEMVENEENFLLRLSEKDTKEMVEKYSKPVNYLISKLVLKYDPLAFEYGESQVYSTQLNKNCVELAKIKGIELNTNKKGLIDSRVLTKAIKEEFELFDIQLDNGEYKPQKDSQTQAMYYPDLIKNIETWEYIENNEN